MAQRVIAPELQALFDKGYAVYSYSKLSTIDDCPYSAKLTYIEKNRGIHNIYDICGNRLHDTLEAIVNGEATEADLKPSLQAELDEMDMVGIDFPRDRNGGTAIRDKWISNMDCFCRDFRKPKGVFKTEQLLILKLSEERYLQGYADLIRYLPDGSVQVLDWKSSSLYSAKDLKPHGRQLTAYSIALEQAGYTVRNPVWIFLKYVEVTWMGRARANSRTDTKITKVCDRCKLGIVIRTAARDKMRAAGYDSDFTEKCLNELRESNDINVLPENVRKMFRVVPHVLEYNLTDEVREECIDYINRTADKFEKMQASGEWPHKKVSDDKGHADFFCTNLCGHRKVCPYLRDFLDQKTFYSAIDWNGDVF